MLARLDWMTLKPRVVLDAGSGIGQMTVHLQKRYPDARVIALDLDQSMVTYSKSQATSLDCICADAGELPFKAQSVDLIFANLFLPWHDNIQVLLHEWSRVLNPDGLIMLTALGPDTLKEWRGVVSDDYVPERMDMHDLGDLLLDVGLADPVLDVDYYTMTYSNKEKLVAELTASGMLTQSHAVNSENLAASDEGVWSVTYEIVYAHAFAKNTMEQSISSDGTVKIPLAQLRQQLNSKS